MHRKLKAIFLAAALSAAAGGVVAQDFVFSWNPRSGDVWVDNRLNDINQYGYRYRDPFIDEMTRYYGAPRDLVSDLLINRRWAPGDIYYACALAQVVGQPCRSVVDQWDRNHGQGWGVIAMRHGIKPGSPQFHRLKKGFVLTYDRWGRPIQIDDALRVDFPHRGKGPKGIALFERPGHSGKSMAHDKGNDHGKGMKSDRGQGNAKRDDHPAKGGKSGDHGKAGGPDKSGGGQGKAKDKPGKGHGKG
ncbi:MAG: hypothetical protein ABIO58_02805 [Luteimonas sp.]